MTATQSLDELLTPQSQTQWRRQGNRWIMPALQSEFLDWLLCLPSERKEQTEAAWAASHKVAASTVTAWKRNDRFRAEWARRAAQKNVSVDRLQMILDMLFAKAMEDNDTVAATKWLSWVERYMPPVNVERDEEAANLSDDELLDEMRDLMDEGLGDVG